MSGYWLAMWSYRIRERLTPNHPKWLHRLTCSHCRSMAKYADTSLRIAMAVCVALLLVAVVMF